MALPFFKGGDLAGNAQDANVMPQIQAEAFDVSSTPTTIDELLSLIDSKLKERFSSFAQAFRAFDVNTSGALSLNEFVQGLETYLKIKLTPEEL